jgi:holin (3TMs family)
MGLIRKALGLSGAVSEIGAAVTNVAEVFVPNATKKMVLSEQAFAAIVAQYGGEFQAPRAGWFDRLVNGLNRLPRPALAIGTLGLFVYAMASPEHFSERMQGLAYVPEPLWWLLGAVVSFYFGAREMYYTRQRRDGVSVAVQNPEARANNAALAEWNRQDR